MTSIRRVKMAGELSRRALLKSTGLFAVVGGRIGTPQTRKVTDLINPLSAYMAEAGTRQLPNDVLEKTKHVILDTFAAMISGSELPPGKFAIQFARAYKGEKIATVAASNILCGPMEAALVNGMLAHSDETDDTHS